MDDFRAGRTGSTVMFLQRYFDDDLEVHGGGGGEGSARVHR